MKKKWSMWDTLMMTSQYPMKRKDGIYLYEPEDYVSCLLCYRKGQLVGTLNHYNIDIPEFREKKGNVFIVVKPLYQGKGIATKLLEMGIEKFNINLDNQTYTKDGKLFLKKFKK